MQSPHVPELAATHSDHHVQPAAVAAACAAQAAVAAAVHADATCRKKPPRSLPPSGHAPEAFPPACAPDSAGVQVAASAAACVRHGKVHAALLPARAVAKLH
eukprot:6266909-Alexandrium_andersonii.AAC.1